jgi:hypothetical protein
MLPGTRGVADGPAVLPQTFTAAKPAGAYSQQVAAPKNAVSTPGGASVAPPSFGASGGVPLPPVVATSTVPSVPAAAPERPAAAARPASPAPSPFDGAYSGAVDVLDTTVNPAVMRRRQIDVRVVNGVGSGTVTFGLCDEPGEVSFVVDASGAIRGRANTRNTVGCTERMTALEGRVDGAQMHLILSLPGNPQLVMPKTQAAAAPGPVSAASPHGRFDGAYSGAMELAAGDVRQVWLRVVGTKGSGSVRWLSCPQPGLISIDVAPDGSISGNADVQSGPSCTPRNAAVRGHVHGARMAVTLAFPEGQASREVVFTRRSYGSDE